MTFSVSSVLSVVQFFHAETRALPPCHGMAAALLILYLLIGPLAWLGYGALLLLGRERMARLQRSRDELPPDPPTVTILVPAKDEAAGIDACLRRVLAQDYPRFDVIAIDDRSADGTGEALDRLAAETPRLESIHIKPGGLPPGWLGKSHALHVGAERATGDWLLLVDSDVTLQPDALRRALALALAREYDALTILTRLETSGFWDALLLPVLAASWASIFAVSLTNDDRRSTAAANGQFFLIRAAAYRDVGGHAAVRDRIVEDVELARKLKAAGRRVRFFSGAHLASTRMHATLRQMFHGWARIYAGTARRRPRRIAGALAFLLIGGLSVYPALLYAALSGRPAWLATAGFHLLLLTLIVGLLYRWSGRRAWRAVLFPLTAGMVCGILAFALRRCATGRVDWRGTQVELAESS